METPLEPHWGASKSTSCSALLASLPRESFFIESLAMLLVQTTQEPTVAPIGLTLMFKRCVFFQAQIPKAVKSIGISTELSLVAGCAPTEPRIGKGGILETGPRGDNPRLQVQQFRSTSVR